MKKFTKQLFTGVIALGLLAPVATQGVSNNPQITVNAKRRHKRIRYKRHVRKSSALSYYYAKKDVRKAYNGKDKLHDHFRLHNHGRHGNKTYLKAPFGANAGIYFTVTHSGRYAHIHTLIRVIDSAATPTHNTSSRYYHFYGVRRNKTVRAY